MDILAGNAAIRHVAAADEFPPQKRQQFLSMKAEAPAGAASSVCAPAANAIVSAALPTERGWTEV